MEATSLKQGFVPVWYGFAMVFTEEGCSVANKLTRRWLAISSNKRLVRVGCKIFFFDKKLKREIPVLRGRKQCSVKYALQTVLI